MEDYGQFVDIETYINKKSNKEKKENEYVNEFMLFSLCYNLIVFYLNKIFHRCSRS